jgi:hypothetical protein
MGQELILARDGLPVKAQRLATRKTHEHDKANQARYCQSRPSAPAEFKS